MQPEQPAQWYPAQQQQPIYVVPQQQPSGGKGLLVVVLFLLLINLGLTFYVFQVARAIAHPFG